MELSSSEKSYFKHLFILADVDKDGVIGTSDATFLRKAKLADQDLGNIWQLADNKQKGFLTEEEFYLVLRMISACQNKQPISKDAALKNPGVLPNFPEHPPPITGTNISSQEVQKQVSNLVITPQEKEKFSQHFKTADMDKDGYITGTEARDLFSKSGLSKEVLAKIWHLSDMDKDTKLNQTEFILAMYLISSKLKGIEVPDVVPPFLLQSIQTSQTTEAGGWILSAEERSKFKAIFERAITPGSPSFIGGEQAKKLFGRSGLPNPDLAKIWILSDQDKDQKLNEDEFIVAMFLINQRLKGTELPEVLPDSLKVNSQTVQPNQPAKPVKPKANYDIDLTGIAPTTPVTPTITPAPGGVVPDSSPVVVPNIQPQSPAVFPPVMFDDVVIPQNSPSFGMPSFGAFPSSNFNAAFPSNNSWPENSQPTTILASQVPTFNTTPAPLETPLTPTSQRLSLTPESVQSQRGSITPDGSTLQASPLVTPQNFDQIREKRVSIERNKEELKSQLLSFQGQNKQEESELREEEAKLEATNEELKNLEKEIQEEKTKNIAIREKLKYIRMQLKTIKEQKAQLEAILEEKRSQYKEDEEIHNDLEEEFKGKEVEVKKIQKEIDRIDAEKQTKQKMSPTPLLRADSKPSSDREGEQSKPTKVEQPKPKEEATKNTDGSFGDFAQFNSNFGGSSFGTNAFGEDSFGKDSFGTNSTQAPMKKDSFSTKDTFGGDSFGTKDSFGGDSFGTKDSFGGDSFGTKDSFGGDSFGTKDSFGGDSFGTAYSKPKEPETNKISPALPPKKSEGTPKETDPFATNFHADFHAFNTTFTPDSSPKPEPKEKSTSNSFSGGFGMNSFTNDSFGSSKKNASGSEDEDPFAFSTDLKAVSVDTNDATFGPSNEEKATPSPSAFTTFDFGPDGDFTANFNHSTPKEKDEKKQPVFNTDGFGADFSSAFSNVATPFDTGADFFG